MKKIILLPAALLLAVILVVAASCGKKQDTGNVQNQTDTLKKETGKTEKVTQETETKQSGLDTFLIAGYMYWVPPAILNEHWAAVITGEVVNIEKRRIGATDPNRNEVFGMIKINKVLHSEPTVEANMKDQKYIRTDALKGFKPGDKVLVYFVKYENKYAIKRDNVRKISGPDDELLGLTERYISNSQDSMKILENLNEYKAWGKYDKGTASRMMQFYEEKLNTK
ncbi:MAG TPA: hypothetical protein VG961_09300 [Ignavibacteria bacterium]|nr:hypothetical protein [Ignavibacteria bacterium]